LIIFSSAFCLEMEINILLNVFSVSFIVQRYFITFCIVISSKEGAANICVYQNQVLVTKPGYLGHPFIVSVILLLILDLILLSLFIIAITQAL